MKIFKNVTYIDLGWLDSHLYSTFSKWLEKQNIEYTTINTVKNSYTDKYYVKLLFKDDIDIERVTSWLKEIGIEEENAV